ncbi:hypothetical protein ACOSQ3_003191 [Xanthoceras sorbifolium]
MSTTPNQATKTSNLQSLSNSPITDVSSPYFLHSSYHHGALLVSNVLTGDNYPTWKRSMKIALNAKNKLRFIDASMFGNGATTWCCHGCSMELRRVLQVV